MAVDAFTLRAKVTIDDSEYKSGLDNAKKQGEEAAKNINASTIALGNIMAGVIKSGAKALVNLGKQGVQYNAQIEQYTTAITTALGGTAEAASEAAEAIEQIKADAASTPFSVDGLTQANMLLMSAGENATDARKTILALTEAVSASGGGNAELQRMAANLQQIKNTGQATAMDIRQFANAGINIYGILADYTGKTTEQVKDMTVSYELLTAALQAASEEGGRFYGSNIAQSQTLNGMISTLSDNIQQKLGEAFEGVTDKAKEIIPAINDLIVNLDVDKLIDGVEDVGIAFVGLTAAIKLAGIGLDGLKAKAIATGTASLTLLANPVFLVVTALTALVVGAKASQDSLSGLADELGNQGETAEEVSAKLDEMRAKYEEATEAAKNNAEMMDNPMIEVYAQAIEELETRLAELTEAENNASDGADGFNDSLGRTPVAETQAKLQELATAYQEVYGQMEQSVAGYFGAFEEAGEIQGTTIDQMIANLQSQVNFNQTYADSMQTISKSGIEGMDELAQSLAGAGEEGAQYAVAIADAIESGDDAKVMALVDAWNEVQASQQVLTSTLAQTSDEFDALKETANGDIDAISEALSGLDGTTVHIYYEGTMTGDHYGGVTGTPHATGLEYVPFDDYPAILHKGERVLTAQESRALNSGTLGGAAQTMTMPEVNIPITLELDGATLARKTYKYNIAQQSYHGTALINT